MDPLHFKTNNPEGVLAELGLYTPAMLAKQPAKKQAEYMAARNAFNGTIYQGNGFLLVWLGRPALETRTVTADDGSSYEQVVKFADYELFNVWVDGQELTNKFCALSGATLVYPETPNVTMI